MQGSVRVRILLAAIAVELSYAFGLPLAYVAGSGGCGAYLSCFLRDGLCFFACVNPWTQFPGFFIVGLLIGTPAAVLTGALAYATRTARTIPLPIALPSLFLALPLAVPIFDVSGIVVALLAVPIASAILVVAAVPELRRRAA